jgi:hypothetical protein
MTEMIKGPESLWAPYFKITEKTDMMSFWKPEELQYLQDEIMKAEAMDEIEALKDEFDILYSVAS